MRVTVGIKINMSIQLEQFPKPAVLQHLFMRAVSLVSNKICMLNYQISQCYMFKCYSLHVVCPFHIYASITVNTCTSVTAFILYLHSSNQPVLQMLQAWQPSFSMFSYQIGNCNKSYKCYNLHFLCPLDIYTSFTCVTSVTAYIIQVLSNQPWNTGLYPYARNIGWFDEET